MTTDPPRARWSFFDPVKYEAKRAELVEWRDTPGLDLTTFAHVQERIDCLDESAVPDDYLGVDPFR